MKFNKTAQAAPQIKNLAGGEAYAESPKLEFASILLTSFISDQFYRSADDTTKRIKELLSNMKDKKFAAKAAIFARTKYGMRSVSHVVAGELALQVKGEEWTKNFFDKVVFRPDDMAEILAYYISNGGVSQPNALKKGFAKALERFDAYSLGKYRMETRGLKLVDIVNLVHPKYTEALTSLMKGTLKNTDTWEAKLSEAGQSAESEEHKETLKADAWKELLETEKIGYFALLKNLRNIVEQAPEMVEKAAELVKSERRIKKSLVLPFRYITAMEELHKLGERKAIPLIMALAQAAETSLSNVPKLDGDTLVALDISGSMAGKSSEVGSLFAAAIYKANQSDIMLFNQEARYVMANPMDTMLTIAKQMQIATGGTDFRTVFDTANKAYKRIVILSDMQAWVGNNLSESLKRYRSRFGADPFIYSFDLAGYGSLQFPERNVFALAGWSEKCFDMMKLLEEDRNALVNEIEKVQL